MAIQQDPLHPSTLLTTLYGYPSLIFRSTDRGQTWARWGECSEYVISIQFNPTNSSIVYACGNYVFFKSTNGGETWASCSLPVNYYAYDLAVDPANPANLYVGTDVYDGLQWCMGFCKSTDGGEHWTGRKLSAVAGAALSVAVDQVNPALVYLGGWVNQSGITALQLLCSTNGGTDFQDRSSSLTGYQVTDIAADPVTSGKLVAATISGVYRSTNAGVTWTINSGYVPNPYQLSVNRNTPALMYLSSYNGVPYKSTDGGVNWLLSGTGVTGSGYSAILVEAGANPYVFFGNNLGIFRSTTAGATWCSSCTGMVSASITALRMTSASPATMYAAFANNAVFKTSSPGSTTVTWERLPEFYACTNIEDISFSPTNPDKLYAMEGGT